ncbi:MAG: glycoside hydrolase [Ignavibacteria bacterium]|nr:glycoside hydrolase [Ignavibacteria bacterium]
MLPLRVAFLWHQHQPYYKKDQTFILPWVRLHGAKDYYDLPALLREFPAIKQTINLAPSLMIQIDDYLHHSTKDRVQILTEIPAELLTDVQKKDILSLFFLCNQELMILPYERYRTLHEQSSRPEIAIAEFTSQDWCDLQTWYNLTWIGQLSRSDERVERLFKQGSLFTEADKLLVLTIHLEILGRVLPVMKELRDARQIEISVTPMYHPISPLLISATSAREALPNCTLPDEQFDGTADAELHIKRAQAYFNSTFNSLPRGIWPSEGSVSMASLDLMVQNNIAWAASDEDVLWASTAEHHWTDKFFPRKVHTPSGTISLLFRDHALSDAIGFVYSRWDAIHAADDFCRRLREIRAGIVEHYGEKALEHAVVPVILDGENCWEYYFQNGAYFLRSLYSRLSSDEFLTVTCEDATNGHSDFLPPLQKIRAGSWINANFKIWIGHAEDNAAWSMLAVARRAVLEMKHHIDYTAAYEHILIAEGSDWCWWYGDDHVSANQAQFDELFRWNIEQAYRKVGLTTPENIFTSILGIAEHTSWSNAHFFEPERAASAMHSVGDVVRKILYRKRNECLEIRIVLSRELQSDESIMLTIQNQFTLEVLNSTVAFHGNQPVNIPHLSVTNTDNFLDISVAVASGPTEFFMKFTSPGQSVFYPTKSNFIVE